MNTVHTENWKNKDTEELARLSSKPSGFTVLYTQEGWELTETKVMK